MAILRLTCPECNHEFNCEPYLSKPRIVKGEAPFSLSEWSEAVVEAKTVCPRCGCLIKQTCSNEIYPDDIIALATRRYRRG